MTAPANAKPQKTEQKNPLEQRLAGVEVRAAKEFAAGGDRNVMALQRSAGNRAVTGLVAGRSLDPPIKQEAQKRFGESFEDVRIHADSKAARAANTLGASAFTHGRDIVFAEGKYAPQTSGGRSLLAHELAHVVQQRRGGEKPAAFDKSSRTEADASRAAQQFSSTSGSIAVNAASSAGIARQESEEPWWKKRLNPIYQKAREVLPPEASAALKEANDFARDVGNKYNVGDQQINQAVKTAEPVVDAVAQSLGVKSDSQPPKTDEQKEQQSGDITWLGTPPIEVQLEQRRQQQKVQAQLNQSAPGALAPPIKNKPSAPLPDLNFQPDPDPTEFETKLKAGKKFNQIQQSRPGRNPQDVVWLGRRPSDEELAHMQIEDVDHPGRPVRWGRGGTYDTEIVPDAVMPIRDPKTHELKGYRMRAGETMTEFDRNGQIIRNYGLEAPLEHPLLDPIDAAFFVADVAPLAAKGLTAAGKVALDAMAKAGAKDLAEAETEDASSALLRDLAEMDPGTPANDVTLPEADLNSAVEQDVADNVIDLEERRGLRIENSDERAIRIASGQDFSQPTAAAGGGSGRRLPVIRGPGGKNLTPPPIRPVWIGRRQGPWLDLQAMFSGSKVRYIGNKAFIKEQELDGVLFDRIEKNVLGEVKGDYTVPMRLGSQDAADRLLAEAGRQWKVARKYGMGLEWHVRKQDLAGFRNVISGKYPRIRFVTY